MAKTDMEVTITGVVIPDEWDLKSKVTGIMISTTFEEEYRVMDNGNGRRLLEHLNQEVQVIGKVYPGTNGEKSIMVKKFSVMRS